MSMHNPPHPGETLREDIFPELGLTVTAAARGLHYSPGVLARITNGNAPISADLAVRLERAGIGKARVWLAMQLAFDLWQAENREQPTVELLAPVNGQHDDGSPNR